MPCEPENLTDMDFSQLMDLTVQNLKNKLRAEFLKRRLRNSHSDIELSEKRIENARAVIKHEKEIIKKWQEEQPMILSELRQLGAI